MNKGSRGIMRLIGVVLFQLLCLIMLGGEAVVGAEPQGNMEKVIRVGYPIQTGFTELGAEGDYYGYTYDYLMEIAQYTNWKYEFVTPEGGINEQLTVLLEMLQEGEIDLLGAMNYSDSLASVMDYSGYNYGTAYTTLSVLEDNRKFNSFNFTTFDNIRVVVVSKSQRVNQKLVEFADMNGFLAEQIFCNTEEEAIRILQKGEADALLGMSVNQYPVSMRTIAQFAPQPFYFTTTKGNKEVVNGINMALASINETNPYFMTSLYEQYFSVNGGKLSLSDEEMEYIRHSDPLKVFVLGGKAPIQYIDREGVLRGISLDLLDFISSETGLQFQIIQADTYDEYLKMLENKSVDLVAGVNNNYEIVKEHQYAVTIPYVYAPLMIAINDQIDPNQLAGKRLALPEGIEYGGEYMGVVIYYDSVEECLRAVSRGEADYCYGNSYSIQYYMNSQHYDNINTIAQPEQWAQKVALGVMKPVDITLLSILNKVIKSLPESSSSKFLYNNAYQAEEVTLLAYIRQNPSQVAVALVVLAMGIAIIFFIWSGHNRRKLDERKALENERYEQLSELSNEFLYEYDVLQDTLKLTDQSASFLGCEKVIRNLSQLAHKHKIFSYIASSKGESIEVNCDLPNGAGRWLKIVSKTVTGANGTPTYCVGKLVDIQKEQELKNQLIQRAERDSLTGVYNAATSRQLITERMGGHKAQDRGALIIMDIDNFKGINDRLGHYTGDEVLKVVANVLFSVFSEKDLVGRLGGDEFVAYMDPIQDVEELRERCKQVIEEVGSITSEKQKERITMSIGVALTCAGMDYDDLYKAADQALYAVKGHGRDGYEIVGL